MSDQPKRKVTTCARFECKRCDPRTKVCPDDCEYDILHVLDPFDMGGLHRRPRQSGKTTELIRAAMQLADYGYLVFYVTKTYDMARNIERSHPSACRVKFMGASQLQRRLHGFAPAMVLTDELNPADVRDLHLENSPHMHVGGFYSEC